jgi:hypothetical protein
MAGPSTAASSWWPDESRKGPAPPGRRAGEAQAQASDAPEARLLDTEIENSRQRPSALSVERQARIAELRQQQLVRSESRDISAWPAELTRKAEAVAKNYLHATNAGQARLDAILARRAVLGTGGAGAATADGDAFQYPQLHLRGAGVRPDVAPQSPTGPALVPGRPP